MTLGQWIFAALIVTITVISFIVDVATKGKYRSRSLAVILLIIGVIAGLIYALSGTWG